MTLVVAEAGPAVDAGSSCCQADQDQDRHESNQDRKTEQRVHHNLLHNLYLRLYWLRGE